MITGDRNMKKMKKNKSKKRIKNQVVPDNTGFTMILYMVKLNFTKLTPEEQIMKANAIISKITNNPHFPNPEPSMAEMIQSVNEFSVAQRAMNNSKKAKYARDAKRDQLEEKMGLLQDYVQFASKRNPEIIMSSGMDVRDLRQPVGFLPAPVGIKGKNMGLIGNIKLQFKPVPKSSGYRIEGTTNPEEGWPLVMETEKASVLINDLKPGGLYYFRIATLSRAGYDGYSQIFMIRIHLPAY